jgi:hypothetical protein
MDNWYIRKQHAALREREKEMPSTIKKGSKGEDVIYCQTLLNKNGLETEVDGIFGSGTESQVKSFQGIVCLAPDGVVGPNTWYYLELESRSSEVSVSMFYLAEFLSEFLPQVYKLSGAQCPSNPPGMSLKRIGMETTNCVLFTSWLLSAAMPVTFTKDQWSLWMVSTTDTQVPGYGPRVIMEWGAGSPQPGEGPWLVQWFTSTGGHSIIVLADDPDTGKVLTLEANDSIDGAGWNQIGPLREVANPGTNWADKVTQTWSNRIYSKRAVHIVSLNVTGVKEWLESA